jgi:hypothetical protein
MGRNKIGNTEKKIKISISISPEVVDNLKNKCINISSLINKLLKEYIENEKIDTR